MPDLAPLPDCARYSLRGGAAALGDGCAAFGLATPAMLHATAGAERAALRLGPDEILLIGPSGAAAPDAGAVVDVSQRQVALALSGSFSEDVLAAGCPLDVQRFGVGQCTRTLFGKAEIVLWRTAPASWRVEVWRSFAAYVQGLMRQAALDWA